MKIGNQAEHFSDVSRLNYYTLALFYARMLYVFFAVTPLANLRQFLIYTLIFGVTPIGCLRSVNLTPCFLFFRNTSRA